MALLLRRMVHRLTTMLHHVPHEVVVLLLVFWCIQFAGWICMMLYVQLFNQKLGRSVLYVTQISHWALVEAAGTAALSSWALLQAKHNQGKIEKLQQEEDKEDK